MKIFTADDIRLMGEPHHQYGQSYWGSVAEQAMPVKFNMKSQVDFVPGRKFTAEEYTIKTSAKGTDYMQLKGVKLFESAPIEVESEWDIEEQPVEKPIPPFTPTAKAGLDETPSYEGGTNARWALKLSVDTFKSVLGRVPDEPQDHSLIEDFAKWLLGAFQRLKTYNGEPGYDKAKQVRRQLDDEE